MRFTRCCRLERLSPCYDDSWLRPPRLVLSEGSGDFAGFETVLGFICLTWRGLRRFELH